MMKKTIVQRLLSRFFRSRVLPILMILLLLGSWLAIAAAILWQAKVKEEFPIAGVLHELDKKEYPGLSTNGNKLIRFSGTFEHNNILLHAGERVWLSRRSREGNDSRNFLDAKLIQVENQSPDISLILQVRNWNPVEKPYWIDGQGASLGTFNLVVRRKRLLLIAWEKKK